jgi:hypothetical protein
MPKRKVTQEDLDEAKEALDKARAKGDRGREEQQKLSDLRTAWKEQEIAAGRRTAGIGVVAEQNEE